MPSSHLLRKASPIMGRRDASILAMALGLTLCVTAQRPEPLCAQGPDPSRAIEVVLDASGSMAGRMGAGDRMDAAREVLDALRTGLKADSVAAGPGLRVYGGGAGAPRRDCGDTRRVLPAGASEEAWTAALAGLRPNGVSPLALALERTAAEAPAVTVLITNGLGNCGGDACALWRDVVARRGNEAPRARLHVIALAPDSAAVEPLRCLSRAGSGAFLVVSDPDSARAAGARLARVLKDRGLLDVRLWAGAEPITVPVRVLRPLTGEVVAAFSARGPREIPAGVYTVVIETMPSVTLERVMILPGTTHLIERRDFGRLVVEARDANDTPLRARVSVRRPDRGGEVRYLAAAEPVVLRSGRYDVVVELEDSLVVRHDVAVETGATTLVTIGGRGTVRVVAPGFAVPPATAALLYGGGRVDTLWIGRPAAVPAGHYRLVARTLPVYVTEEVDVEAGRETRVTLPQMGVLGVDVYGPDGLLQGLRVDVREPMTQEVYGALQSGERRLAMPGTYALELATAPPRRIDGVRVAAGVEEIVVRRGLGLIVVEAPLTGPARLELLAPGGRVLGEASGPRPSVAAWPGTYQARVWQGARLLWEGRITVAAGKRVRIDWTRTSRTPRTLGGRRPTR